MAQILKLSSKQCIVAPQKNWAKKTKKKIFAEGLAWPSAKGFFAEGLASGPRQRRFIKKNWPKNWFQKNLCRGPKNLPKTGFTEKKTFAEA